ncbi:MAG: SH3 domain-containing protein [Acidobacteria bacterium]|nr:SH3 domain-containing protein [Acidobacteriota bacterium]
MKAKRAILFCAAALLLAGGLLAGAREDFAAANRRYEQGLYAEALALYLKVAQRSDDWQVSYNIGNCHYKLGDYLSAKVSYLKARKRRPLEPAIARNIAMTNRHFRDDAVLPAPDFVTRAVQTLESALTRGRDRRLFYALAFSLLFVLGLGACHVGRTAAMGRSDSAVVRAEDSQLRSGPGADNTVLFTINPGLEVRIIDRRGDWVQVTASERIAGWIEKKRLVLI